MIKIGCFLMKIDHKTSQTRIIAYQGAFAQDLGASLIQNQSKG